MNENTKKESGNNSFSSRFSQRQKGRSTTITLGIGIRLKSLEIWDQLESN